MTPELRSQISNDRLQNYYMVMFTVCVMFLGVAGILVFSDGGYSAPLTMVVILATLYGILAGTTALNDVDNLIKDMTPEIAATHYGKGIAQRNMGALKIVSGGTLGLTGLAELWVILF